MNVKITGLGLFLIMFLGVLAMTDYPDWTIPTNITNSQLDVYITNSTMDVRVVDTTVTFTVQPVQDAVFYIEPTTTAVFNIQGDVNITNSTIDVRVVDTTVTFTVQPVQDAVFYIEPTTTAVFNIQGDVNATIQGTASISIDNATITIDVATVKEKASELGKIYSYYDTEHLTAGSAYTYTVYTNNGTSNAYLEVVTVSATNFFATLSSPTSVLGAHFEIKIKDPNNNVVAKFFANPPCFMSFDPAFTIPPNYTVEVEFYNASNETLDLSMSIIIRTE